MRLSVLVDNNSIIDRYFLAEPALSLYIEDEGTKILFDAGYSDAFITNAKKMGIDLTKLDFVIISHGHLDHTWGLDALAKLLSKSKRKKRPILIAHPDAFLRKHHAKDGNIGSKQSVKELSKHFKVALCAAPVWLTSKLVYLGEIPRKFDFENKRAVGSITVKGKKFPDMLIDDTALAYNSPHGITIVTGCSHSGVCNITEHAKKICKNAKVNNIIGGLHLLRPDKMLLGKTGRYLKNLKLAHLYACHCTDLASKITLAKVAPVEEVGVGLDLKL